MKYGIHWFRRDLRVAGNRALAKQCHECEGRVLGVFCFDKKFLDRDDFSINRFQFFLEAIVALKKELQTIGSDLLVLDIGPQHGFKELFKKLKAADISLPHQVSWNRDYEPFAVERDQGAEDLMKSYGVASFHERDHLLVEPHELEKDGGGGYQVFSPFARKWNQLVMDEEFNSRVEYYKKGLRYLDQLAAGKADKIFKLTWDKLWEGESGPEDVLNRYVESNSRKVSVTIPRSGSLAALEQLRSFRDRMDDYGEKRDIPSIQGTSRLSMYMKNGSITTPMVMAELGLEPFGKKETGSDMFLNELIWREFYYHILARHPRVENEPFLKQYKDLEWSNSKTWFDAWKEGKTGFPIVDAGMRELKQTGWMHNRVRMIVASFLTKDLLIDWRWGEQYFMETLLDGDLAPNNGGWQWAASTGCDPQPYFRIFNPWLQGKKFDPDGKYIKRYVGELEDLPAKKLHSPINDHKIYPKPIVDHKKQREIALDVYKRAR
ncbi:cryptochrome/photolyase family protein [Pseudobacteriovorax antillogorgiicola]|uniref:Deoxyribodipyrimidine photo-lyase n=1 Tax=Pseudobacteriovorax antillogorgiicola TaxID=1513793 RepID=A0A1Y6CEF9_9BACT|nr:deoxyribodipyrimidine photo-lyase [Pseudobacteriovorax antillogorgiicola]TCS48007.1 deoxyribodipyrimidine photo-lyase [Pseudobacteriovorax antillogorgiicola]SMF58539.1 deoxyribodipyrimidine photo-lyase [Pseudobacteriovorax antillogorgiicola]